MHLLIMIFVCHDHDTIVLQESCRQNTLVVLVPASLKNYLCRQGIIRSKAPKEEFSLSRFEDGLQRWREDVGVSMKVLKSDVRSLGVNLSTGQAYGSAGKLEVAMRHGAPTANRKKVKNFQCVKACLVEVR